MYPGCLLVHPLRYPLANSHVLHRGFPVLPGNLEFRWHLLLVNSSSCLAFLYLSSDDAITSDILQLVVRKNYETDQCTSNDVTLPGGLPTVNETDWLFQDTQSRGPREHIDRMTGAKLVGNAH